MSVQWPLVLFTLFITLGAGTLGVTGVLAIMGKDEAVRIPALAVSFIAAVVGGLCSFFHLQHWERIFNGFGNITSGITQELIGLVLFVAVIVVYFAFVRRGDVPKWVGILAIAVSVLLVIFMSHSYAMPSRPAWDNVLMYAFYLGATFLLGALSVYIISCVKGAKGAKGAEGAEGADGAEGAAAAEDAAGAENAFLAKLTMIAGAVQTVIVLAYGVFASTLSGAYTSVGNYFDSTVPLSGMKDPASALTSFMTGENALLFWGGALILGAIIPLIVGFLGKKAGKNALAISAGGLVCALLGGIAFRVILYNVGYAAYVFY